MNNEKKKKIDAVGWKSYCSRLYCGAGRWQALGAGRRWALAGAGRWQALGAGRRWAHVAGRTARSKRWASVRAGRVILNWKRELVKI